ncbi:MAG: hypothetical protein AAF354_12815 [Pseudomonadota bacterium]
MATLQRNLLTALACALMFWVLAATIPSPTQAQPGPGRACLDRLGDGMCWTECSIFFDELICFDEAVTRCCWDSPNACGDSSACEYFCGGDCGDAGSGF